MKITKEELIKIATENQTELNTKDNKFGNDVQKFVAIFNIKDGKHIVKPKILYQAYLLWSPTKMGYKKFVLQFEQLFLYRRSYVQKYFLLNYKPIELLNKVDNKRIKLK